MVDIRPSPRVYFSMTPVRETISTRRWWGVYVCHARRQQPPAGLFIRYSAVGALFWRVVVWHCDSAVRPSWGGGGALRVACLLHLPSPRLGSDCNTLYCFPVHTVA